MNERTKLERLALDAHRDGWTWHQFWREHGEAMKKAEPVNRRAYHRLADHLLALVVSGHVIGHTPVGDDDVMPWERDDRDQPEPSDVKTNARLQPGTLWLDNRPCP